MFQIQGLRLQVMTVVGRICCMTRGQEKKIIPEVIIDSQRDKKNA